MSIERTAGPLQDWVREFVARTFPEAGIEYFSQNEFAPSPALKAFSPVPEAIDHVGAYVYRGRGEGNRIRVVLIARGNVSHCLTWAKSFGSLDECWQIARAIAEALTEHLETQQACNSAAAPAPALTTA